MDERDMTISRIRRELEEMEKGCLKTRADLVELRKMHEELRKNYEELREKHTSLCGGIMRLIELERGE